MQTTQTVDTLLGQPITITKGTNGVKFADAEVIGADVLASNGIIHVINKVVLPPAPAMSPLPTPVPTAAPPTSDCRTCTEDDSCFKDVRWAIVHGFRLQPGWYESLSSTSCFEVVQMFLHWRQREDRSNWDGMLHYPIPLPCPPQASNYMKGELLYCR